MTVSEYRHLKAQLIKSLVMIESYHQILGELKNLYKSDINSRRRLQEIDTITRLLNILEKRDILSEDNVEALKVIGSRLPNSVELLKRISDYEAAHVERECTNYYDTENNYSTIREAAVNNHRFGISKEKLKRVRDVIVEQIGKDWKDLGRNLSKEIQEWQLDQIDVNHPSLMAKALELMLLYERKADSQRWFMVLCIALEKSRRKDLQRLVQEIMTMNL